MKREVSLMPVIAIGLLIVAAVAYFFLIHPKRGEIGRLSDEIGMLESQVSAAQAETRETSPAVRIKVADLFALAKAMPNEEDMAGVVLELNSIASSAGVEFLSIAPQGPTVVENFVVLPISLRFVGNYYDLTDFLFRLRNLVTVRDGRLSARGRVFTLDQFEFREGPNSFPSIEANLTVSAYMYGVPAGLTPAAAPTTTAATTTTEGADALGGP